MRIGTCLFLLFLISGVATAAADALAAETLDGFSVVAENDWLTLYLNEKTVEFAVLEKASGVVWHSNPPDRDRKETVARGVNKAMLNSQLVITFFMANRQYQMDSYNDSVLHDQYSIHPIPNGFRVDYQIGRQWQDEQYLPVIISEERFNELILSRIERARDRNFIRSQYILFELERGYVDADSFSILGVDLDALLGEYGFKVHDNVRATDKRRALQEYLIRVRDAKKYTSLSQVTTEDIQGLFDTPTLMLRWDVKEWDKEALWELAKEVGYTPEQVAQDHESYNIDPPYPDLRSFKVSVEYFLDGDTLVARIPGESISYPERVLDPTTGNLVTFPLTSISLLNYFGASDNASDGYIFVPDGSGALIDANNGKTTVPPYTARIYGRDYASQAAAEYSTVDLQQVYLPVFGLKDGDRAFLAVVEEGDGMARIEAMVSGMRDSFNKAWASFDVLPQVRVFLDAEGELIHLRRLSLNMYQSRPYRGNMTVRYAFLTGEEASYAGMARRYRQYLVERYGLERMGHAEQLPLLLDVIGSIDRVQPVMGIPSTVVEPLTTYGQAQEIVDDLLRLGVDALEVRYLGWLSGGINHDYPAGVRLEKKVGDAEALRRMAGFLAERGVGLYPSVDFGIVHRNKLLDGFVSFSHASRFLNRNQAYLNIHNIATYQPIVARRKPLLSPSRYPDVIGRFAEEYAPLGVGGLALGDLGRYLYSDFRLDPNDLVERQAALEIVTGEARRLREMGLDLVVEGGNAYLLPYTRYVANAPWTSRGMEIIDRSIPFFQMALSGYVGYAAPAANLAAQNRRDYILRLVETGSLPAFTVAYADSSAVKHTPANHLYSITYHALSDEIITLYQEAASVLSGLWGMPIVDHQCVDATLCRTEYEDGTAIWVNYSDEAAEVSGHTVPAKGHLRTRPEEEGGVGGLPPAQAFEAPISEEVVAGESEGELVESAD